MKLSANSTHLQRSDPKPMEIVGAGPLLSTIWKLGDEQTGWRYRFNLTRQTSARHVFTDLFQPLDLVNFIKLIQVVAAEIANDGCLMHDERVMLRNLAQQLDVFLGDYADGTEGKSIPATINNSQDYHSKGTAHGQTAHP